MPKSAPPKSCGPYKTSDFVRLLKPHCAVIIAIALVWMVFNWELERNVLVR